MTDAAAVTTVWEDAVLAATLLAVNPQGLGGVVLRAAPGPVRDRWTKLLRSFLPPSAPFRQVPLSADDDRLIGGLDLAATLQAGRPVAEPGLFAQANGGILLLAMAERLPGATAARLAATMDQGEVVLERDGFGQRHATRFGVIALDEGIEPDERPPDVLGDRLAIHLDLGQADAREVMSAPAPSPNTGAARARLNSVAISDELLNQICTAALLLGVESLRAALLAAQVARTHAALFGRDSVCDADVVAAGRLVLAPRATTMPAESQAPEEQPQKPEAQPPGEGSDFPGDQDASGAGGDMVVEAIKASLPRGLLAKLVVAGAKRTRAPTAGKAGALQHGAQRGRPVGVRQAALRDGLRLNLVATLRAAAPWQTVRRRELGIAGSSRVVVRRDDIRITRFKKRSETTTIFVVDASGSSALQRLAEAKGAVELLLADCYVRRDRVALVAFRGPGAEIVLPPSRSLARAKRSLGGLAGGGAVSCAG